MAPSRVLAVADTPYDIEAIRTVSIRTVALLCGGSPEKTLQERQLSSIVPVSYYFGTTTGPNLVPGT